MIHMFLADRMGIVIHPNCFTVYSKDNVAVSNNCISGLFVLFANLFLYCMRILVKYSDSHVALLTSRTKM